MNALERVDVIDPMKLIVTATRPLETTTEKTEPPQHKIIEPAMANPNLYPENSQLTCGCQEGNCNIHVYCTLEEISAEGLERLENEQLQTKIQRDETGQKILCYRAKCGFVPELRDFKKTPEQMVKELHQRIDAQFYEDIPSEGVLLRGDEITRDNLPDDINPRKRRRTKTGESYRYASNVFLRMAGGELGKYGLSLQLANYPDNEQEETFLRLEETTHPIELFPPDELALSRLQDIDLPFATHNTDVTTLIEFDPAEETWEAEVLPNSGFLESPNITSKHYPNNIITGMKAYKDEEGNVMVLGLDLHLKRACDDAKARGFENLDPEFLKKVVIEHLTADARFIPQFGDGASYYFRLTIMPANTAPPLKSKTGDKARIYLTGTPVGFYVMKEDHGLQVAGTYERPVHPGEGNHKLGHLYAGPVARSGAIAKEIGVKIHELLFVSDREGEHLQEGISTNLFIVDENGIVLLPNLDHKDILPGITTAIAEKILRSGGYSVMRTDITIDQIQKGREIIAAGTAMNFKGVEKVYAPPSFQNSPVMKGKIVGRDEFDQPILFQNKKNITTLQYLLEQMKLIMLGQHPDQKLNELVTRVPLKKSQGIISSQTLAA